MGQDLATIIVQNLLFIGSYGINTNVICLFVLFKHKCYMFIRLDYTRKSCTWLMFVNNAWHLCLNDTNPWNNKFHMVSKQTHEAYKFLILINIIMTTSHQKVENNPHIDSTHTAKQQAQRYWQQLGPLFKVVNLAHNLEMPLTKAFHTKE